MAVRGLEMLLLALTSWPLAATAVASDALSVLFVECREQAQPALDKAALLDLLRVELMPRQVQEVATSEGAGIVVDACVNQLVSFRLPSEQRGRSVSLTEVEPALRPRLLALALAELVRPELPLPPPLAASAQLSPPPAPPADGELPPALQPRPQVEVKLPARRWFGMGVDSRLFGNPRTLMFGPRMTLVLSRYELGALVTLGSNSNADGSVQTGLSALAAGYPLLQRRGAVDAKLVAATELGLTWGQGTKLDGEVTTRFAPFAAALARASLGTGLFDWAYLQLSLLGGFAQGMIALGYNQAMTSSHGPFVGVSLELASLL